MFFDNCLFIKKDEKEKMEKDIIGICSFIKKCYREANVKVALYFSGSLARKEPTYEYICNEIKLGSDLDFVLVYDNKEYSYAEVFNVTKSIREQHNKYDCSFVILDKNSLKKTNSFFKRDISLNGYKAFYDDVGVEAYLWGESKVDKFSGFESIITQACCYFLHPQLTKDHSNNCFFRKNEYHKIKLILECFRTYLLTLGVSVIGYNDVLKWTDMLPGDFSRLNIEEILKAREQHKYEILPPIDLYKLLDKVFIKIFNENYYKLLSKKIKTSCDKIEIFQYSAVLFFMANYKNISMREFLDIENAGNMKRFYDTIGFEKKIKKYIQNSNRGNYEEMLVEFRKIRNEFVRSLHERNTAEEFFTDTIIED